MSRTVVIGAGPNGLIAACYLARAGHAITVVDAAAAPGGMCVGDEFHPGYRSPGPVADTARLRPSVIAELSLERHGLELARAPSGVLAVGEEQALWIPGELEAASDAIARSSAADARAYRGYREFLARVGGVLTGFVDEPPVELVAIENHRGWDLAKKAWRVRRLGRTDMRELMRIVPMPVKDWLDEWFELPLLKAALAAPALAGGFAGPRSPGTSAVLLLSECTRGPGSVGGGPALIAALTGCLSDAGGTLRLGAAVSRIAIEDGRVRGVVLGDGETLDADCVVCTCDPKTALLDLIEPRQLTSRLEHHAQVIRCRGTTAHVALALRGDPMAAHASRPERAVVAAELDTFERAFDAVKYRRLPDTPALEVWRASAGNPALCPEGDSVLSVRCHFVPYELEGGWTDGARDRVADAVVSQLERAFPGLAEAVVGRAVLAPPDIERRYLTRGGNLHHGELGLDQLLVRPVPEAAGYRTPIAGLYLGGAGSHPGGELTGSPARLCARAITGGGRG